MRLTSQCHAKLAGRIDIEAFVTCGAQGDRACSSDEKMLAVCGIKATIDERAYNPEHCGLRARLSVERCFEKAQCLAAQGSGQSHCLAVVCVGGE
jgi:hypothetical protein